ncbi:MAG: TlpA family protein disulfide reductase [Chloroflexota bacterium]
MTASDRRRRPAVLLLAAALVGLAGAAPAAAQESPPEAPSCLPEGAEQPMRYDGWPVPGQAQASGDLIPYIVSTQLVAGPARILLTLLDSTNAILAAPDVPVTVALYDLVADPATPVATVDGAYLDPGTGRGLYRIAAELRCWGDWGMEVTAGLPGGPVSARVITGVLPAGSTPRIGTPAPLSDSPVGTTSAEIAAITTDLDPEPAFYAYSIADAVTSGRPSAILFATPMLCATATCGPTLDIVKKVAAEVGDALVVVHVEPYQLRLTEGGIQPLLSADGQLQPLPAVFDWGLPTEPYLFIVDAQGRIAAALEGIVGEDELRAAVLDVLGGATAG